MLSPSTSLPFSCVVAGNHIRTTSKLLFARRWRAPGNSSHLPESTNRGDFPARQTGGPSIVEAMRHFMADYRTHCSVIQSIIGFSHQTMEIAGCPRGKLFRSSADCNKRSPWAESSPIRRGSPACRFSPRQSGNLPAVRASHSAHRKRDPLSPPNNRAMCRDNQFFW